MQKQSFLEEQQEFCVQTQRFLGNKTVFLYEQTQGNARVLRANSDSRGKSNLQENANIYFFPSYLIQQLILYTM